MAFGNSIGQQGLFGSQRRPGMRALPSRLGSLSGSSLGDDTPLTADPAKPGTAAPASSGLVATLKAVSPTKLAIGAAAVWYLFLRKKAR